MRSRKSILLVVVCAVTGLSHGLSGQGTLGTTGNTGQTKADLISAAFSSYLSGDIAQARQYLNRASQLDMEDVTIRRLLENLTPVVAPVSAPSPAISTPRIVPAQPAPSLSASERMRMLALQNGVSEADINAALQPPAPAIVPTTVAPPLLLQPVTGSGKLDFSGFQEATPQPVIASATPSVPAIPSILPAAPAFPSAFPITPGTTPDLLSAFPSTGTAPTAPTTTSISMATSPSVPATFAGTGVVAQQLASKQQSMDSLIAQITQATIGLNQAQQTGDVIQVQAWEAELAKLRNQLRTVDAEVVQLKDQLAGQVQATPPVSGGSQARSDLIGPGETIEVFVMQDESFNGMYQVRQGGYILIPQVGRVPVAGMTVPSAESSVAKAFSQTMIVNPTIIIERPEATKDEEDSGGIIYLMGDFKRPGTHRMQRGRTTTILNTIIQSGGETQGADLSRVRLMRLVNGRNLVEEINVNEMLKGGGLANDMILRDGDILHIPSRPEEASADAGTVGYRGAPRVEDPAMPTQGRDNGVFVTGRVKSAGFVALTEEVGLTAYSAILAKGGFAPFANIKKVYVVREVGGGQKVHIPVNIRNVQHGLEPDVELQVKDIVVVPEKFFSL